MNLGAAGNSPDRPKAGIEMKGIEDVKPRPQHWVSPCFLYNSILGLSASGILVIRFVSAHPVDAEIHQHRDMVTETGVFLSRDEPSVKKLEKKWSID